MQEVRIELLKHSAVLTWPEVPGIADAGRLRVYTGDGEERERAHAALCALGKLLAEGNFCDVRISEPGKGALSDT